ncbi:MAG: helix-turn-helix domain-containing protein, partial [Lactobacillus sp.]|nr:helix-turn-helix domain-containing protein [Lactobacillus sp.]
MIDLKSRRESLGLSQEEVAKKINVTKGTVSKWEKGYIENMRRDKIASLAKVLKINPLLLLGIDPEDKEAASKYNFFDIGLSAGALSEVSPFKASDVKQITLPDSVMGKYARNSNVIISRV